MNQEIRGRQPQHENGWCQTAVWEIDAESSGQFGDRAIGTAFIAYYEKPGTNWKAECGYFVTPTDVHEDDPRHGTYGVEVMYETWEEDQYGDQIDPQIDYDHGTVFCYETPEKAEEDAKLCALRDESHTYCV